MIEKYQDITGKEILNIFKMDRLKDMMCEIDVYGKQFIEDMFNRSVIYFIWKNHEIVYIGQSKSLMRRVFEHVRDKEVHGLSWINVDKNDIDFIEYFFIDVFRPELNGHHKTGAVENKRRVTRKYKEAKICGTLFDEYISMKKAKHWDDIFRSREVKV